MTERARRRIPVAGVALALAVLAAASGCARSESGSGPRESAVLLTVDTWRADCFGAGGNPALRTPHIDRFFRRGFQFAEAYSPVPTTLASHTSLLTGQWPTGHGVPRNLFRVPEDLVTLAEILSGAGFRTAAYVSSAALDASFNLDQGFDVYDSRTPIRVERDYPWRPAAATLERARRWWGATGGRKFLWVHLFEPHFPYEPSPLDLALYEAGYDGPADGSMEFLAELWKEGDPTPEVREHLIALYHAEITGLDRALGEFLAELAGDEATVVVLTSDHGESLGEYGIHFMHGPSVFPHDLRVPLVVRGGNPFRPGLATALVRSIDVPATFLSQLGVTAALPEEAGNLEDWVDGGEGLPVFGVASMPKHVEVSGEYRNLRKQRVARTATRALVETPWAGRKYWYDRTADPGELRPGEARADSAARILEDRLDAWIEGARVLEGPPTIDPDLEGRLRALGYVY